ncbi:hypothetical protein SAMD00019534_061820, partial [Acytostelium subglobosum LB1]|uniref:hypothetical protein n=1 Tax=Acytostelium subglobosum LB1 TaxID=1410327 RepID=UPI00064495E8
MNSSGGSNSTTTTSSITTVGSGKDDLEERYLTSPPHPIPSRFEKLVISWAQDEHYITHATFRKSLAGETSYIGLLTSYRFYKVDPDTNRMTWSINIVDMHSVEGDEAVDPKILKIVYHLRPTSGDGNSNNEPSPPDSPHLGSSSHQTSGMQRLSMVTASIKRATGSHSTDDSFVGEKSLVAESEDARDQWLIALRQLMRNTFQKLFESSFIPAPAVYQLHLYVYKTNRKGKNQIRCILVSTERVYNISVKQSLELGKPKWSFSIGSLKGLQVFKNPTNLLLINIDSSKESGKIKETQQFVMRDTNERNLLANELKRLYTKITKGTLSKEEKDEHSSASKKGTSKSK